MAISAYDIAALSSIVIDMVDIPFVLLQLQTQNIPTVALYEFKIINQYNVLFLLTLPQ
jgi:hypothetical protein